MAEQSRVAAQRAIEAQLHKANGRAPPTQPSVEWIGSQNIEISRTQPDDPSTPWDYIGHRFPREKSPGTAVHSKVLTEGKWAAEFKVLESKGLSGAFGPKSQERTSRALSAPPMRAVPRASARDLSCS